MAEVVHRYVHDPQLVAEQEAAAKMREKTAKRKEAAKAAKSRLAQRGIAELRLERTEHERTKRLEREMSIALKRGQLVEKEAFCGKRRSS